MLNTKPPSLKKKIKRFLGFHFMFFDFLISFIMTFLIFIIVKDYLNDIIIIGFKDKSSSLFIVLAQISGALLGFIITGFSIILVATQKSYFDEFKKSKHYDTLVTLYRRTIFILGFNSAMFLTFLIIPNINVDFLFVSTLFLSLISILFLYRCITIIMKISYVKI